MALSPESRARFNLARASVLLLDPTPMGLSILAQTVSGLGARTIYRCSTLEDAKEKVGKFELHLMIIDGMSDEGEGTQFIHWLRREAPEPNKYVPVLLTTGYTRLADVSKARDCGAHFTVAKPIAPIVMLERIIWVAKEGRPFLLSDNYVGPERRFKDIGPPKGMAGRRRDDPAVDIEAEAVSDPNLATYAAGVSALRSKT